ncbi:uncharacterized protein LOC143543047 isoform X2 [Bidens hawaiensis]|uniref:uncharacterized protein LOC143543047 isoform X2 n=1 Tax=Bidens hawaiensis TaxID=980011 RepID=UPI0040490D3D
MSAGMAAKVQAKTYFHSSMMDLNNGLFNVMWDPYHDNRNQGYNSFLMSQTMDGYPGYPKEQMRQTILKQESIFRHQLQELHRVYKRQRDLMNEIRMKDCYSFTIPAKAPNSGHFLNQACSQRRVIDLELPADVEDDNEENQPVKNVNNISTKRAFNLADLNEPIQTEEASSAASFITKNSDRQNLSTNSQFWYSQAAPNKANEHLLKRKTLFGVEISESSRCSWDQNTSSHAVSNGIKNLETQLPHWLTQTKGKETAPYQMNLDSLQQHSQQFFKKSEKLQTDNSHGITKILGVPVPVQDSAVHQGKNTENDKNNHVSELRHVIDLNMSFDEEEDISATPNVPETVVNIASTEIDLETPAALEPETDADDQELVKSAAEAIVSISSSDPPPAGTLLMWFAEVIESDDCINIKDSIPEGMDEFEYMTLKLEETEVDNHCYKPVMVTENEEDGDGLLRKPVTKKGVGKRGRQRKDFQRDVLPGIVTLSRREVTEDLQTFEEAFNGIGVSWQSKRKGGRGRRQTVALSPPRPPPVEESDCREVVTLEEKSLSGWGKRTRRLPRQRCQNGGNHQSLALKCYNLKRV